MVSNSYPSYRRGLDGSVRMDCRSNLRAILTGASCAPLLDTDRFEARGAFCCVECLFDGGTLRIRVEVIYANVKPILSGVWPTYDCCCLHVRLILVYTRFERSHWSRTSIVVCTQDGKRPVITKDAGIE